MVLKVKNYIAGKFQESSNTVDILDFTNKDIIAIFPDASSAELRAIRRHSQSSQEKIKEISLDKKKEIIKRIAQDYLTDKEIIDSVIKIKGTTLKDLKRGLSKIKDWTSNLDKFISVVFGSYDNFVNGEKIIVDGKEIARKIYKPRGETAIILSRNMEAYEQFYVLAQGILSSNHLIVRASTGDIATYDFFKHLDKHGGKDLAQLVYFSSERGFDLVRQLLQQTKQSIIFASDNTINEILSGTDIANKNIINKYGTGLPIVFVTKNCNIKEAAAKIVEGSLDSRGCLCISTTPVFVEKSISSKLYEEIKNISSKLVKGNPLSDQTDIASYSNDEIQKTKKIISESGYLKRIGNVYENTMDLNLLMCSDDSIVLQTEIPGVVVGLIEYSKLSEAVNHANSLLEKRGIKKWILSSVLGNKEDYSFVQDNLICYMVRNNTATSDLNLFLPHQGTYFILSLIDVTY